MTPWLPSILLLATSVTTIPGSIAGTANAYVPTDAERARWTMSDMKSMATAIEAYATDRHAYPDAANVQALVSLIQPTYMRKAHGTDAWGRDFVYVRGGDGKSYRLVSAGSDGKTDPGSWGATGPLSSFDDDAVLDTGAMTRPWPFR